MNVTSGSPQAILNGIDDQSIRALDPVRESLPQHLPYVQFFAERGPEDHIFYGLGSGMTKVYGAKSFDYRERFANHSTVLVNSLNEQGNLMALRRVVPADATMSMLRLYVEMVASELVVYERNDDGSFKLDADGKKIDTGATTPGIKLRWVTREIQGDFGSASKAAGDLQGSDPGNVSTMYPVLDMPASSRGAYGNNLGFRLSAPTLLSNVPVDDEVVEDQKAFMYRLQILERSSANGTPFVQKTLNGDQYVEFSFKDGVINPKVDTELSWNRIVESSWRDVDPTTGLSPVFGPMDGMKLYDTFLAEALQVLGTSITGGAVDDPHYYNIVSAVDVEGVPYDNVELVGAAEGGVLMNETAIHYLTGGSDGTLDFDTFDKLVADNMDNFENDPLNLLDTALHPFTRIYDSGYSLETKKKLFIPMGLRKGTITITSTQDVSEDQNTVAEESSMAIALRTAARMYPESHIFGTATCRALVVGHSGYLVNSNYTGLVPMTIDLAIKSAKYMGASDGIFKTEESFDSGANKLVSSLKDVNCAYKSQRIRNKDWAAGLVWVQNYDRRSLFYPQFQTVYDNDTSINNSYFNVSIAAELEMVAERVWRDLTGDSKLTVAQFIQKSNDLIEAQTVGRFDDRVVIVPETFQTPDDSTRGYSWSCNIIMYGNNMKTVGSFTIVSRRREDLE